MLSWPQNAANPISKDLNFKNVPGGGEDTPEPTYKRTALGGLYSCISNPLL